METRTREQAEADGYPVYNNGPHITIDVPDGHSTLSCVLSNGQQVTFAFCSYSEEGVPKSIDIMAHKTGHHVENGSAKVPTQRVMALGCGPTNFRSTHEDESPTTMAVLLLDDPPEE